MGLKNCRECNLEVSSDAKVCPHCGKSNPYWFKALSEGAGNLFGIIIGIVLLVHFGPKLFGSEGSGSTSGANCAVSDLKSEMSSFIVNGEPDAGVTVNFTVENRGDSGEIEFEILLSTSDGEYSRNQTLHFDGQESRRLTFNFTEPTINTENIQVNARCRP